jgi:DNA-binding NarL/FixJ family response regulator
VNAHGRWTTAVVAEDWGLYRLGVCAALRSLGVRVVGDSGSARDALRLLDGDGADLAVLGSVADLALAEAVRRAKRAPGPPGVVALLARAERDEVARLLGAGVDGLLARSIGAWELGDALRRVLAGERVVAPAFVPLLLGAVDLAGLPAAAGGAALTGKEREVLARLAEGRSNRAIASALCITPATVKTHLVHIYEKLGARDRHDALVRAVARGLLA